MQFPLALYPAANYECSLLCSDALSGKTADSAGARSVARMVVDSSWSDDDAFTNKLARNLQEDNSLYATNFDVWEQLELMYS
jgi:hypothetical protein